MVRRAGVSDDLRHTPAWDDEQASQLALTARPLRDDEQAASVDAAIASQIARTEHCGSLLLRSRADAFVNAPRMLV